MERVGARLSSLYQSNGKREIGGQGPGAEAYVWTEIDGRGLVEICCDGGR